MVSLGLGLLTLRCLGALHAELFRRQLHVRKELGAQGPQNVQEVLEAVKVDTC